MVLYELDLIHVKKNEMKKVEFELLINNIGTRNSLKYTCLINFIQLLISIFTINSHARKIYKYYNFFII